MNARRARDRVIAPHENEGRIIGEIGGALTRCGRVGRRDFLRGVRREGHGVDGARHHLPADRASRPSRGMDVHVEIAGHEVGNISRRHPAPYRVDGAARIAQIKDDRAVDAGCAAVDVHHCGVGDVVSADEGKLARRSVELPHAATAVRPRVRWHFLIGRQMEDEQRGRGVRA
jgi:hypothetical protein